MGGYAEVKTHPKLNDCEGGEPENDGFILGQSMHA